MYITNYHGKYKLWVHWLLNVTALCVKWYWPPSIGIGASLVTVVGLGRVTVRSAAFAVLVTSWNGLDLGFVKGKLTSLS